MQIFYILAAVLGIVLAVAFTIRYAVTHKHKPFRKFLLGCGTFLFSLMMGAFIYVNHYYKADEKALAYLRNGTDTVTVSEIGGGYKFDGPGTEDLLIFYPGGKVEAEAYAPLLGSIAEQGVDCVLAVMPLRLSILNGNAADSFLSLGYRHNYIGGHSLGGTTAAIYCNDHAEQLQGVILLAAFPTSRLSETLSCLSVYGSNDNVLNRKVYEKNRPYFPDGTRELVIEGGNHAMFGNYGEQNGDGAAAITREEQQAQTAGAIAELILQRSDLPAAPEDVQESDG